MRILVVTTDTKADIAKLLAYAKKKERWYNVRDRSEGWLERLPGHDPNLRYEIRDGYGCVFSYSYDTERDLYFRHLSISVPGGLYPAPEAVLEIAKLFGFDGEEPIGDRVFPSEWSLVVNRGEGPIDDRCIVVMQPLDHPPA